MVVSPAAGQDASSSLPDPDQIKALEQSVEKAKKQLPAVTITDPKGRQAAKDAAQRFYGSDMQQKIRDAQERLHRHVLPSKGLMPAPPEDGAQPGAAAALPDNGQRLYVFISASVPERVLRTYAADLAAIGAQNTFLVMRGLIGGLDDPKPTIDFAQRILVKTRGCRLNDDPACDAHETALIIDPILFGAYGIDKVPAVVYAQNVNLVDAQLSQGSPDNLKNEVTARRVFGDVSLAHALQRMHEHAPDPVLKQMADRLNATFYTTPDKGKER